MCACRGRGEVVENLRGTFMGPPVLELGLQAGQLRGGQQPGAPMAT